MAPLLPEGHLPADAAIDLDAMSRGLFSGATSTKYDSYINEKRGWVEFCEARDWDPLAVCEVNGSWVDALVYSGRVCGTRPAAS